MSEYSNSSIQDLHSAYHGSAKSGSSALDPPVPLRKLFPSQPERSLSQLSAGSVQVQEPVDVEVSPVVNEEDEFLLKKGPSLVIVILSNVLLQVRIKLYDLSALVLTAILDFFLCSRFIFERLF